MRRGLGKHSAAQAGNVSYKTLMLWLNQRNPEPAIAKFQEDFNAAEVAYKDHLLETIEQDEKNAGKLAWNRLQAVSEDYKAKLSIETDCSNYFIEMMAKMSEHMSTETEESMLNAFKIVNQEN